MSPASEWRLLRGPSNDTRPTDIPVRCGSTIGTLECASEDGRRCMRQRVRGAAPWANMTEVAATSRCITTSCPGWPSVSGDACDALKCRDVSRAGPDCREVAFVAKLDQMGFRATPRVAAAPSWGGLMLCSLVTLRYEGLHLLPWLAYHRLLGVSSGLAQCTPPHRRCTPPHCGVCLTVHCVPHWVCGTLHYQVSRT